MEQVSFEVADALNQPFPEGKFDLVWSMESGEHMPDKKKFVNELVRVAAPGGRIIIVTWCHRDLSPSKESLRQEEKDLLNKICSAYYLPAWCSTADYVKRPDPERSWKWTPRGWELRSGKEMGITHLSRDSEKLTPEESTLMISLAQLVLQKLDVLHDGSVKLDGESQKDSSSALTISSDAYHFKHRRSFSKWNDDILQSGSTITETTQAGELISGSSYASKLPIDEVTMQDHMDLLVEQVKMLAGEIAFGSSTLKRLVEQSANDPESSRAQIQNLECEIQEKRNQMRVLEQRIVKSGEASVANASMVEMQQTIMKLMTQCSEKGFELEIKSADNRVLQEQLQMKCAENKEMEDKILHLEQQLASVSSGNKSYPSENCVHDEYSEELRKKVQSQIILT
ncbi:Kinesin motor family protein [Perilla frutescens var. frutescens]|nr:Kinesin motor family protein [Perilla frutescens var. frutescens]